MQFYQPVIAKADTGQALAAKAQYRLAVCLDKKKDHAAATAAYEKLIQDYPNQKNLVALANNYLSVGTTLSPAPWSDVTFASSAPKLSAHRRSQPRRQRQPGGLKRQQSVKSFLITYLFSKGRDVV